MPRILSFLRRRRQPTVLDVDDDVMEDTHEAKSSDDIEGVPGSRSESITSSERSPSLNTRAFSSDSFSGSDISDPDSSAASPHPVSSSESGSYSDAEDDDDDWSTSSPGDSGWSSADYLSDDDDLEDVIDALFEEQTIEAIRNSEEDSFTIGTPPASQAAIRDLPCICVTAEDLEDPANHSCIVCLEPNRIGDTNVTRLPCTHMFHVECLHGWLNRHCTCPVCRYEIPTEDEDFEVGRSIRMCQRKPRYSESQLQRLSIKELKALLPGPAQVSSQDRQLLINYLVGTKAIELIAKEGTADSELNSVETRRTGNGRHRKSPPRRKRGKRGSHPIAPEESAQLGNSGRREDVIPDTRGETETTVLDIANVNVGVADEEVPNVEDTLGEIVDEFLKDTPPFDVASVGDSMLTLTSAYTDVGCSCVSDKKLESALEYFEKALLLCKTIRGMHHPETADALDLIGSVYCDEGDYDCALAFHGDALEVRRVIFGADHAHTALSHFFVGWVFFHKVEYDSALKHQNEALRINEIVYGDHHATTARTHVAIGYILRATGDLEEALKHFTESFNIRLSVLGEAHHDTTTSLSLIGAIQHDRERYPEALFSFKETLRLRLVGDKSSSCAAVAHANLAVVLSINGDATDAIRHYEEALQIYKLCFGLIHVDTASVCYNLGRLHGKLGNYDASLELLEQALSAREVLHSRGEIRLGEILMSCAEIGLVLMDTGRYREAFERLEASKNKFEQVDSNCIVPVCRHRRSDLFLESVFSADIASMLLLNKRVDAWQLSGLENELSASSSESSNVITEAHTVSSSINRSLSFASENLSNRSEGESDSDNMSLDFCDCHEGVNSETGAPIRAALSLLAEGYSDIGRFCVGNGEMPTALDLFTKALSMYKMARGASHPETSGALDCVATVHSALGDYDKALRIHEAALQIRKSVHGGSHPHTATSYFFIGSVQSDRGEYEDSLSNHKKALDIREEAYGLGHDATATSYEAVACLLHKLGVLDGSLEHNLVALSIRDKVLGSDHPRTARSYSCIGSVQRDRGLFSESMSNHERAREIRQKVLGASDPDTASTASNITYVDTFGKEKVMELEACEHALATFIKIYGKRHELTAAAQNDLGILHHQLGNYEMALKLLKKSIKTRKALDKEYGNASDEISATKANMELVLLDQKNLSSCFTAA